MTEQEALELGKKLYANITNSENNIIKTNDYIEFVGMAIKALEEIQQYRAIGTVEECREAVEKQMEIRNKAIDDFMNIVEEKADGGYFDVGGYHDVTNDIVGILDQLAEQLKGSAGNEVN